jgi:hypothetical protein
VGPGNGSSNNGSTGNIGVARPATGASEDPAMRKNEASFKAARDKCDAVISKDSQLSCMQEAETNYRKGGS